MPAFLLGFENKGCLISEHPPTFLWHQGAARPWQLRGWDILYWCYIFMCNPKQVRCCQVFWFLSSCPRGNTVCAPDLCGAGLQRDLQPQAHCPLAAVEACAILLPFSSAVALMPYS